MSGIVFDIKRFAIHDGPGIRTSIFFKGCPLSCWWCHNPESRKTGIENLDFKFKGSHNIGWETTSQELLLEIEKDKPFYEQSGGGITFTGGEPLLQADFLIESAKLFKQKGYHVCLDTTGYAATEVFKKAAEHIDLFLFDLKHMDDVQHKKYTGVSNKPILKNLEYLAENGKKVQIRFPYIPKVNGSSEHLQKMADYLHQFKNIKNISLLPYHKIAQGKYEQLGFENKMNGTDEPTDKEKAQVELFFENQGFNVKLGA